MERDYTILESEYTVPVEEILADCVDVPKFLALCKACPNYGNRWSCPPYQGNMYRYNIPPYRIFFQHERGLLR